MNVLLSSDPVTNIRIFFITVLIEMLTYIQSPYKNTHSSDEHV